MSAAMRRQMLEQAGAYMQENKYQEALDAARRVVQFDASNFQAILCVGMANFHLQQWEDAEEALQRATELKPELPAPWKNLVDLYDVTGNFTKKVGAVETLIAVFQRGGKIKPCQKWICELATTATTLKLHSKAFDAWYSLVDDRDGSLSVISSPNPELPTPLEMWLDLIDLMQLSSFSLSDATENTSMTTLADQFLAVAKQTDWATATPEVDQLRGKTDTAIAMFLRDQLDRVKEANEGEMHRAELTRLDEIASHVVDWFPTARFPMEYLLLRSEDQDSPIDTSKRSEITTRLMEGFAKSPISLMMQGFSALPNNPIEARTLLMEALASCSSSSFHESSLCVRVHMELADIALMSRDVDGCLSRLASARTTVDAKNKALGCSPPISSVYSDIKIQLMHAQAYDLAGKPEESLGAYQEVLSTAKDKLDIMSACTGAVELLSVAKRPADAMALLDASDLASINFDTHEQAIIGCTRAWVEFLLGSTEHAKLLFQEHTPQLSTLPSDTSFRARASKRQAIVFWHIGDEFRTDKKWCFSSLLLAAKLAPKDGEVFSWIGKWYLEVASDIVRAEKCFLKALALSPLDEIAGLSLSELYDRQGKTELNVELWKQLTDAPESAPTWALLRLAQFFVDCDDEQAVGKLHLVLRNEPQCASHWVAMGHVYRHFGKTVAAQRSYTRAIELGAAEWCVYSELARIEGALGLFTEALEHAEQALSTIQNTGGEVVNPEVERVVITVFADLLFQEAKSLNGDGLYGRAANNVKKAADLLTQITLPSIPVHKLIGDVHSFAFYLSPLNFEDPDWCTFIAAGREAYESVVTTLLQSDSVTTAIVAEAQYDVGVSCWYEALARCSVAGISWNAFTRRTNSFPDSGIESIVTKLLKETRTRFQLALRANPSFGLAWNALGVIVTNPLAKQFAWCRAIQTNRLDAAWANLGMLYVTHGAGQLARNAFLQLQAVNPNNPAMWIGYSLLSLHGDTTTTSDRLKARDAFQCALEMGNHLDALYGFVVSSLLSERGDQHPSKDYPSHEGLAFAIKKYLEREPFDAGAWNVLSVVQYSTGLYQEATRSCERSLDLLAKNKNIRKKEARGVANNLAVFTMTKLWAKMGSPDGAADKKAFESALTTVLGLLKDPPFVLFRLVLDAQCASRKGSHAAALDAMLAAVHSSCEDQNVTTEAFHTLSSIALALAARGAAACPAEAQALADACRAEALVAESSPGVLRSHSSVAVLAYELYVRTTGELSGFVEAMQGVGALVKHAWSRVLLAAIDAQHELPFSTTSTDQMTGGQHVDGSEMASAHLAALTVLLSTTPTESGHQESTSVGTDAASLKLVRMQPWKPYVYVPAALAIVKRVLMNSGDTDANTRETLLDQARRLLATGLLVARRRDGLCLDAAKWSLVLLHWATAWVAQLQGEHSEVKHHSEAALKLLREDAGGSEYSTRPLFAVADRALWEARVYALTKPDMALQTYHQAITVLGESSAFQPQRMVATLYELAGFLESSGMREAALHVWKFVAANWKQLPSASFVAQLRLALIHGEMQNTKTARKFSKAVIAQATADDTTINAQVATVARFVENALAKM